MRLAVPAMQIIGMPIVWQSWFNGCWWLRAYSATHCSEVLFPSMGVMVSCAPSPSEAVMPKFVIEREIPGAGQLSPAQLHGISQKSCAVLSELGPQVQWLHSYVTDNKIYCVYIAPNAEAVREHATRGGFPANQINAVRQIIDPTTAESLPT